MVIYCLKEHNIITLKIFTYWAIKHFFKKSKTFKNLTTTSTCTTTYINTIRSSNLSFNRTIPKFNWVFH